jgi:nitroreductase
LYLAQESGVRRFSWESNDFEHVSYDDIRNQIQSTTTSVGDRASAIWIYVIETDQMAMDNIYWAWHSIGAMSQHQYLMADALDIQTRFIGGFNNEATAELLGLGANRLPANLMLMAQR